MPESKAIEATPPLRDYTLTWLVETEVYDSTDYPEAWAQGVLRLLFAHYYEAFDINGNCDRNKMPRYDFSHFWLRYQKTDLLLAPLSNDRELFGSLIEFAKSTENFGPFQKAAAESKQQKPINFEGKQQQVREKIQRKATRVVSDVFSKYPVYKKIVRECTVVPDDQAGQDKALSTSHVLEALRSESYPKIEPVLKKYTKQLEGAYQTKKKTLDTMTDTEIGDDIDKYIEDHLKKRYPDEYTDDFFKTIKNKSFDDKRKILAWHQSIEAIGGQANHKRIESLIEFESQKEVDKRVRQENGGTLIPKNDFQDNLRWVLYPEDELRKNIGEDELRYLQLLQEDDKYSSNPEQFDSEGRRKAFIDFMVRALIPDLYFQRWRSDWMQDTGHIYHHHQKDPSQVGQMIFELIALTHELQKERDNIYHFRYGAPQVLLDYCKKVTTEQASSPANDLAQLILDKYDNRFHKFGSVFRSSCDFLYDRALRIFSEQPFRGEGLGPSFASSVVYYGIGLACIPFALAIGVVDLLAAIGKAYWESFHCQSFQEFKDHHMISSPYSNKPTPAAGAESSANEPSSSMLNQFGQQPDAGQVDEQSTVYSTQSGEPGSNPGSKPETSSARPKH